jgi:hypothetical protein
VYYGEVVVLPSLYSISGILVRFVAINMDIKWEYFTQSHYDTILAKSVSRETLPRLSNMKPSIPRPTGRDVFQVKPVAHDDSNPVGEWFHAKHSTRFAP